MKIFLFTKKKLFIHLLILLIIITIILSIPIFNSSNILAFDLSYNDTIPNEFITKISKLTTGNEKIVYLTFDDGPTKVVTPKILDILEAENIKATFFVIGKSVEEYPEIVKRAYDEGHFIANHGYDHNNSNLYKNAESFMNEIKKTDLAIGKAIGIDDYCSHVFRFPNGFMAPLYKSQKEKALSLLLDMNYTYIDWNCLNNDSERKYTNNQLLDNLKKSSNGKNTLVILMHDTKDVNDSSMVLEESISYLKSQGYEFRNFYDLID